MADDQSVAPKERVNITYKPSTGDRQSEVELPLKMLFVGDYTGRSDERPLEERKPINVDKENFQQVLAEHDLGLSLTVSNALAEGSEPSDLPVQLRFKKLSDFGPDAVAQQVPELRQLLDLREALTSLKSPLGNMPAFRRKLQALLGDAEQREKLMRELGVPPKDGGEK
ncbi:MAG: type VI secretion system contractile sheath small subunit [Polyangiaceae bacterium]|nr:type VI secretion system contractile sheath small subunit [Polyangiaceae bacterium]